MTSELFLRRKWTLRAHSRQVVFVKKSNERAEHVLMKAFLWALYLPMYPDLSVEVRVGDRYKPDVVALDEGGHPIFWAEAGQVGLDKIRSLLRRYRNTHFAIAKWATRLDPYVELVNGALEGLRRGQVFISEGPTGPRVELHAEAGDGRAVMGRDLSVKKGAAVRLSCQVSGGAGSILRLVSAERVLETEVDADEFTFDWEGRVEGDLFFRPEVIEPPEAPLDEEPAALMAKALGNPIYISVAP